MKNKTIISQKYRATLAYFMSAWFVMLVISGTIFTHKEITSTGEIVIHNHPYDFTKKSEGKSHHHSDDEIHFLDVVFCGIYTPTEFVSYEPAIRPEIFTVSYGSGYDSVIPGRTKITNLLRGPPAHVFNRDHLI